MALISIRNVIAPFENKTHLFTIVVVAAVFGVWRASGGSVTSQERSLSGNGIESHDTTAESRFQSLNGLSKSGPGSDRASLPPSKAPTSKPPTSRDKLDSLLAPQQQSVSPSSSQKHHSALDDIEKSLGMR
jgi:hypothetical protein